MASSSRRVARIADVFRPWGVQLSMSVDLASPKSLSAASTRLIPLDPRVVEWWRKKVDEIYRRIPDFGGFVVKADSEGRAGPSAYGRTHADAANVLARALKPHGGIVFYRAFVYNHHLDWRDLKNDRAKAAYDNFHPLDGAFRRQRHHPDQERPHRFSGARAGVAALRRPADALTKPSNCRSRRNIPASSGISVFSFRCGKRLSISTCASTADSTPVKDLVAGRRVSSPHRRFRRRR